MSVLKGVVIGADKRVVGGEGGGKGGSGGGRT